MIFLALSSVPNRVVFFIIIVKEYSFLNAFYTQKKPCCLLTLLAAFYFFLFLKTFLPDTLIFLTGLAKDNLIIMFCLGVCMWDEWPEYTSRVSTMRFIASS